MFTENRFEHFGFLAPDKIDFGGASFGEAVGRNIQRAGFTNSTEIQSRCIPEILNGKDVIGMAQTGCGKTAAFVLPIVEGLTKVRPSSLAVVVVSPTRELAEQTAKVFHTFSEGTGLRVATLIGGVDWKVQRRQLHLNPPHIVVGTPGKLAHCANVHALPFSSVAVLVVDEADQLFARQDFKKEMDSILTASNPRYRQTLMFSATMPPQVMEKAHAVMRTPVTVRLDREPTPKNIHHIAYGVDGVRQGYQLLSFLLKQDSVESGIIFVRSKGAVFQVSDLVESLGRSATCLSSAIESQAERSAHMNAFKEGKHSFLVATDVAGRGIDVSGLSHIINFQFPLFDEDYVHRAGRTGRMGQDGTVITFLNHRDRNDHKLERLAEVYGFSYELKILPDLGPAAPLPRGLEEGQDRSPAQGRQDSFRVGSRQIFQSPMFERRRRSGDRWNRKKEG